MTIMRFTFLLAAIGGAVALYRQAQRQEFASGAMEAPSDSQPNEAQPYGSQPYGSQPYESQPYESQADALSPLAATTPNQAEGLQNLQLADAGMGTAAANSNNEDLLTTPRDDSQQPDAIKPGMPDFWRGA